MVYPVSDVEICMTENPGKIPMTRILENEVNQDQTWRDVEVFLKIESINQGFSKESAPVIKEWLKKRYEDWFCTDLKLCGACDNNIRCVVPVVEENRP